VTKPAAGNGRHALGFALAALAAATLPSCAPTSRPPATLDVSSVTQRYERLRDARERRLAAVRIEATAWIGGTSLGRLPAVTVDLALAGPDAVRARIGSLFGTALDLVVRGDSMSAYVPPRRVGVEIASLEESLGVRLPGAWACRALGATWRPVEARWARLEGDSLWRVAWLDGADSLAMSVGSSGLPAAVELHAAGGRRLTVRYAAWSWSSGLPWPSRCELEEGDGAYRAELRLDRVSFPTEPDPRWMALAIPPDAERLDWNALRRALARLGGAQ